MSGLYLISSHKDIAFTESNLRKFQTCITITTFKISKLVPREHCHTIDSDMRGKTIDTKKAL